MGIPPIGILLLLPAIVSLGSAENELLEVSPTCSLHSDEVAMVTCLNPFLEHWELIRASVAAPGNIIIPVLHYTKDELSILCDLYSQVSGFCFGLQVMDKCGNNSLVTAVRSLGEYVCEIKKPLVQARFDCIDAALNKRPQCRKLIRGIPKPEMAGKKCRRMEEFFDCLHSEIYATCGVWGVAILVQAVDSLNCQVPIFTLSEKGTLELVKNPSKRTILAMQSAKALRELGGNVTAVGQLDKFSAIPEDPRIPEFMHNVRVDPVEAYYRAIDVGLIPQWRLNNAFLPQGLPTESPPTFAPWLSSGPFRGIVRTSRTCDRESDDKALAPCVSPWFDTWLRTKEKNTPPAFLFFPVLFYSPEEILELCDSYVELLDSCLTAKIMETCRKNQFIAFIRSHVGYICSVRGVNILSHFNCLADAVHSKPQCRDMIQSLSISDIRSDRCRTMPRFFECMEPVINQKCGTKGIAILVQAIEGFGCAIEDLKDHLLEGIDSSSREEVENEINLEIFATLPRNHPAVKDFRRVKLPRRIPKNEKKKKTITPSPTRVTKFPRTRESRIPSSPSTRRTSGPPADSPPGRRAPSRQAVLKSVESVEKDPVYVSLEDMDESEIKSFPEPAEFKMTLESSFPNSKELQAEMDHFNHRKSLASSKTIKAISAENKLGVQNYDQKSSNSESKSREISPESEDVEKSSKEDSFTEPEPQSEDASTEPEPLPEAEGSKPEPEPSSESSVRPRTHSIPTSISVTQKATTSSGLEGENEGIQTAHPEPSPEAEIPVRLTTTRRRRTRPPTTTSTIEPSTRRVAAKASVKVEEPEEYEDECTEEQEDLINECFTPMNIKWSEMIGAEPNVHDIVFPLFRYGKWDIYELCNMRTVAIKECLTPKITKNCEMDAILDIVNSLLGYSCGDTKKEFFTGYECVHVADSESPECSSHVTLPPTPGLTKEEKCVGMPTYVSCLTKNIRKTCPNPEEGILVLHKAVENFGCTLPKLEQGQSRSPSRRRRPTKPTVKSPEERITSPTTTLSQTTRTSTAVESTTTESTVSTKVEGNSTVITYHCTPDVKSFVTSCMLPLVGTWLQLRSDREVLNNYSFPLYMYSKPSILELCDHYANAFLRCDFPVFQACLHYEVARFSLNHLGYICRPEVIGEFFEHFDCITRAIAENGQACNRFIEGPKTVTSENTAEDRCKGIPEFYRCGRTHVHRACGKEALNVFKQSMQQMGCRVTPLRNGRA